MLGKIAFSKVFDFEFVIEVTDPKVTVAQIADGLNAGTVVPYVNTNGTIFIQKDTSKIIAKRVSLNIYDSFTKIRVIHGS